MCVCVFYVLSYLFISAAIGTVGFGFVSVCFIILVGLRSLIGVTVVFCISYSRGPPLLGLRVSACLFVCVSEQRPIQGRCR